MGTAPISQTAEALRSSSPKILLEWERRVRAEVESAEGQNSMVLRDHMPKFLESLAAVLCSPDPIAESRWCRQEAKQHGAERANLGRYALEEVILEYHILRQVVFAVLEEPQPLILRERDIIISMFEQAVNDTACQFVTSIRSFQEVFLLGLVHDLRGPTNAALIAAQIILGSQTPQMDSIKKLIAVIQENLRRIERMTADLLDASKAQAGGVISQLELTTVNLVELVHEVLDAMPADKIRIRAEDLKVEGLWSRDSLRRIIENLLGNALKFRTPDTVVTVEVRQTESDALLSVHNHGPAIPLANRARLFRQFSQGTEHGKGGWGIGLVLVKGLVDAHHGSISLESESESGTTLTVHLPKFSR